MHEGEVILESYLHDMCIYSLWNQLYDLYASMRTYLRPEGPKNVSELAGLGS